MREFQVASPPDKSLKKAWGFYNFPLTFFDLSFLHADNNITMPFDTGYVIHVDVDIFHLATSEYPKKMRN
jgi:hypothetical protein